MLDARAPLARAADAACGHRRPSRAYTPPTVIVATRRILLGLEFASVNNGTALTVVPCAAAASMRTRGDGAATGIAMPTRGRTFVKGHRFGDATDYAGSELVLLDD